MDRLVSDIGLQSVKALGASVFQESALYSNVLRKRFRSNTAQLAPDLQEGRM
jgi:hypothetical protein